MADDSSNPTNPPASPPASPTSPDPAAPGEPEGGDGGGGEGGGGGGLPSPFGPGDPGASPAAPAPSSPPAPGGSEPPAEPGEAGAPQGQADAGSVQAAADLSALIDEQADLEAELATLNPEQRLAEIRAERTAFYARKRSTIEALNAQEATLLNEWGRVETRVNQVELPRVSAITKRLAVVAAQTAKLMGSF